MTKHTHTQIDRDRYFDSNELALVFGRDAVLEVLIRADEVKNSTV